MNKQKFVPRYQLIFEDLKAKIEDGTYAPGAQLPFERELCDQYGVQRITVRKSLEMLSDSGLIEKQAGRGSFVRQANADEERMPSNTILFIMRKSQNDIQNNSSAFNAQLFFPMERICSGHGYSLLYTGLDDKDDCAALIERHAIAGVYMVSTLADSVYQQVARLGVPALCINHRSDLFLSVLPDNDNGIRAAMELLIGLGHTRIAFIRGMAGAVNAIERFNSYTSSMLRQGLGIRSEYVLNGEWTYDGGFSAMSTALNTLSKAEYPTAVVAASDMMAIGCMDAIKQRGLSVPDDISVIGFDDIDMCKFCTPQLTSVRTDPGMMARIAFEQLNRLITCGAAADLYTIRLTSKLIERKSAAAPAARE